MSFSHCDMCGKPWVNHGTGCVFDNITVKDNGRQFHINGGNYRVIDGEVWELKPGVPPELPPKDHLALALAALRKADRMKSFVGGCWSGWEKAKEEYESARALVPDAEHDEKETK